MPYFKGVDIEGAITMELLRFTAKPSNRQIIIELPPGIDEEVVEVLVRTARGTAPTLGRWRRPPERLRGTTLHDDLISPAVSEAEWDTLK